MKKTLLFAVAIFLCADLAFSQKLVISNTLGGNQDELFGQDLISSNGFSISDRTQLDLDFKYTEGRWRFDFTFPAPDYAFGYEIKGYEALTLPYVHILAGNSFFSKYPLKAGELHAINKTPSYAKLLKSGIGVYGEIPFGEKDAKPGKSPKKSLKLGVACDFDTIIDERFILDFGADFVWKKKFSLGFAAKDVTAGEFGKYSVLGGFNAGDFRFDAGFVYNNTTENVLPKETKYSLSGSVEYSKDKFKTACDIVSGLNSQYLATNSQQTKEYSNNGVPFMMAGLISYKAFDFLKVDFTAKYENMLNQENKYKVMLYPAAEASFLNEMISVSGGVRVEMYNQAEEINTALAVPFTVKFQYSWD